MTKYYAERGEDKFCDELGVLPSNGFFVDVGCAWPFLNSTTAFLRDKGWVGASIDGDDSYAKQWDGVAPFTHCVVNDGCAVRFEKNGVPELSRISENGELVNSRRLDDLLQYSPPVDFLAVDVEGSEFDVLQTFDWSKQHPLIVIAEHSMWTPDGVQRDERVREMLEKLGYSVNLENESNYVFRKMKPITAKDLSRIYKSMFGPTATFFDIAEDQV